MCNVSVIFDQWNPYIPQPLPTTQPWPSYPPIGPPIPVTWTSPSPVLTAEELREFLDAFHKAVEAAKVFDRLTGQPDCEDPEKAELLDRVAELERRLEALEIE